MAMRFRSRISTVGLRAAMIVAGTAAGAFSQTSSASPRERLLMDTGWRFAFGHASDPEKDFRHATAYFSYFAKAGYGDGPAARGFDDRSFRRVDLPHDWAVELPFDRRGSKSHGYRATGRGFPDTSVAWYRRSFVVPASDRGRRLSLEFDGVHRSAAVWVNGFYLGSEPSGTYGFAYDVTDYLHYGEANVVAVRVDATMEEGWYYEGAGIYRHVWLAKTPPVHVARHGTFVTSEVAGEVAAVTVRTTLVNDGEGAATVHVSQEIVDADGSVVARGGLEPVTVRPRGRLELPWQGRVAPPRLWSLAAPHLYTLITTVRAPGAVLDRYETRFGVRTLRFDPQEGFFLNGSRVPLRGTNNHQDHAGVGTAIPDALQAFRVRRLQEMGSNAYRSAHHPPTPELLDACDRLGMLVVAENRLMGSNPWHLERLERMIVRDRNHPSVILWSLGNEEWAIEGNEAGARITSTMQALAQRLDPTRRVTAAGSGGWGQGLSTVVDVMGFNYIFNGDIDRHHAAFPRQPGVGTEESTTSATRGIALDDRARGWMAPADGAPQGRDIETGFKFYATRAFLAGLFFWTGFDYRGEPNPIGWPQVGSQFGLLDLCGFPKDAYYYLRSRWTEAPLVKIFPHWNWLGREGQPLAVRVQGNCDEVELLLNDTSLGRQRPPAHSRAEWSVRYAPGVLTARGYRGGRVVATDRVETSGTASAIRLTPDRAAIAANGEDVSVVTVEIRDEAGRPMPTADQEVVFTLAGPGRILGVGNGDPASHEPDRFVESVRQVRIGGLRMRPLESAEVPDAVAPDVDASTWRPVVDEGGEYSALHPGRLSVVRGTFDLTEPSGAEVVLFPKGLVDDQQVYVNGRLVGIGPTRDDPSPRLVLEPSLLRPGRNDYAVVGLPLTPRREYEVLNTDPGILHIVRPPAPWRRRAFGGLAQVIVQSTTQPGEVTLTATSDGLTAGVARLRSQPAAVRPAVPE